MGVTGSLTFQFHKGTIRTLKSLIQRLEQQYKKGVGYVGNQFQFHKGTIRTMQDAGINANLMKFQFHKGTIRTFRKCIILYKNTNFNSIKVRLELTCDLIARTSTTIFQFHKGTIRTFIFS